MIPRRPLGAPRVAAGCLLLIAAATALPLACTSSKGGVVFTGPDDGTFFEEGDSSFCCPGGGGDSVEDGLPDGPLWDVGNLGDCTGEVAEMTSQCVECDGPAYALCNGVFYSTCSCDLPPGYVLVRGGDGDGGSKDAAAETAPTDATTNESETKDATDATTKDGGGEGGG